jgi:hypothetical protein
MQRDTEPTEDTGEHGRWLSYDDIAELRGIGRESAVKLVQREKWRKMEGNDGTARALVPPNWLKPARKRSGELSRILNAFEDGIKAIGTLQATLPTALAAELTTIREQIDAERARGDALQVALDIERAARIEAEVERAVFWSQGIIARTIAAWRGRRPG